MSANPLIEKFNTPFETFPFDQASTSDFLPAIKHWIKITKDRIESIKNAKENADFDNTIAALDFAQRELNVVSAAFFNLNSAETSDEMQSLAQEIAPILSEFANDVVLDEKLYERIQQVTSAPNTPEAQMLFKKTVLAFERNGAKLVEKEKNRLREIDQKLGKLSLEFGETVLRDTNSFEMLIEHENDLVGLPDDFREQAKSAAEKLNKAGWLISLRPDSYLEFMKYSTRRDLREKLYLAFATRGMKADKNNLNVIKDLVGLRRERANLLGYSSHAAFILEERMAKSPKTVISFLENLKDHALPIAKNEMKMLEEFAQVTEKIDKIQKWDINYLLEKIRKEKLNIDDEALRPYLPLPEVTKGIFKITRKLFGLKFKKQTNIPVYHPEVETYEVTDEQDNHIAILYMDFFPRDGKRGGAWKTAYRGQYRYEGKNVRPHISIVCNFNRPTKNKPALLNFQELTTYFHEFGHALHGMLADGTYPSLTGTNVSWDFVELPSQLFENWCYEQEALNIFAKHVETGENIPTEMLESIRKQRVFFEAYATIRQLGFGMIDMAWHNLTKDDQISSVFNLEKSIMKKLDLLPNIENTAISPAFSHIFQGGYSAGYYSYKWSEMLEVQCFDIFQKNGIFDSQTAKNYRKLLAAGGSTDADMLFQEFTGEKPNPAVLLNRLEQK